jgi:hypothetical protein
MNQQFMTKIDVAVIHGQSELLAQKLNTLRANRRHLLPGTVARYISVTHPEKLHIVLIWRRACMPSERERQAALTAFLADFADCLAWKDAQVDEWPVLLHT